MRPITPIVNGVHSYAIAWTSKRNDGAPYSVVTRLNDLGLTHQHGYKAIVSVMSNFVLCDRIKALIIFLQDLFDEDFKLENVRSNANFSVRVNPSGEKFCDFILLGIFLNATKLIRFFCVLQVPFSLNSYR